MRQSYVREKAEKVLRMTQVDVKVINLTCQSSQLPLRPFLQRDFVGYAIRSMPAGQSGAPGSVANPAQGVRTYHLG